MGGSSAGSGGGGGGGSPRQMSKDQAKAKITFKKEDDAREKARSTNYTTQPKKSTFNTSKKEYDDAVGKSNLSNAKVAKVPTGVPGSTVLNILQPARQKLLEKNTKFFREKVLTSKNRGGYEDTFDSYSSYMKSRLAGTTDAYGNTTNNQNGGNNNNQTVETPLRAGIFPMPKIDGGEKAIILPTTSEDTIEKRKKKTKATGRSKSIMTSAKGVTKTSSDYSLGKPSLLGQV